MSIYENLQPLSLDEVSTYPLASRPSKVTVEDFASPVTGNSSLRDYFDSLPKILAAESLRELAARIRKARELHKPIIWGIGGHVIKTGLAPVVIDLMQRGFVSAIAGNGSVLESRWQVPRRKTSMPRLAKGCLAARKRPENS